MRLFHLFLITSLTSSVIGCTCSQQDSATTSTTQPATTAAQSTGTAASGVGKLEITDIKVGTGTTAVSGKKVTVHYTGTLTNGKKFDSSLDNAGVPFKFNLGAGHVIPGWEEGVQGMKVGGKRKLVIPPQMAYKEAGVKDVIPPNATLVFDIELLNVENAN